jgi:hypothetical protein
MNLRETVRRQNKMRSDYGLYVVAVICFIIAGVFLATEPGQTMYQVAMGTFAILGILFAAGGYALRPKVPTLTAPQPLPVRPSPPPLPPPVEEKVEEAPVAPSPPTPTPPPAEEVPTLPTPALEEPAKVEEEKPAEKPVRKRRRKKAA